jgi:23S rRNA (cytidine1920-2'-O)/16S rRNA (cytidine1409-2'-O)-methyltransferase
MGNSRLDARLVTDGLAPTRSRARDLILRGFVRVDGAVCDKPGRDCAAAAHVELVDDAPRYVSRGSEKLIAALDHFGFDPADLTALDLGASTGGFTEVLLRRGASRVYAIDVGRGQLHATLRADARVVALEKLDSRDLMRAHAPELVGAVVADVSFISLTKAIGVALSLAERGAWLAALIKPQFECGPAAVGAGGVVRDEALRNAAVQQVETWIGQQDGWRTIGFIPSPILGGSGNVEYLIGAVRDG